MQDSYNEIEKQMAELRKLYLQGIPEKFSEIEEYIRRIMAQPKDTEALDGLLMAVHKLRGSAGSYGFKEAGLKATELEAELKCLLSGQATYDDSRGERIMQCFHDMKKLFNPKSAEQAFQSVVQQAM